MRFQDLKIFEALSIRVPFEVEFGPGINLIFGPNGVGKTTTARALLELIRPNAGGQWQPRIQGRYSVGDQNYFVSVAGSRRIQQVDGNDYDGMIGPEDGLQRYHWALHDLLTAAEADRAFAQRVLLEGQGGYDLARAATRTGFAGGIPNGIGANTNFWQNYIGSREHLKTTLTNQSNLSDRRHGLENTRRELSEAIKVQERAGHVAQLRELRDYEARLADVENCLANIALPVERLRDNDADLLKKLEDTISSLNEAIRESEIDLARFSQNCAQLEFAEEVGDPDAALQESDRVLGQLLELQGRITGVEGQVNAARAAERELRPAPELDGDQLRSLADTPQLDGGNVVADLDELSRSLERARAESKTLRAKKIWLESVTSNLTSGEHDQQQIENALTHLVGCVEAPQNQSEPVSRWPLIVALVGLALLILALAAVHHFAWLAALPLPIALWYFGGRVSGHFVGKNREDIVRRFEECGFGPLGEDPVDRIKELIERWKTEALRDKLRHLEEDTVRQAAEVDTHRAQLRTHLEEIQARLGFLNRENLIEELPEVWVVPLYNRVREWQRAWLELRQCEASLKKCQDQGAELCRNARAELAPYIPNLPVTLSASTVSHFRGDLARRWEELKEARDAKGEAQQELENQKGKLANCTTQRDEIRDRLELAPDTPWVAQVNAIEEACEQKRVWKEQQAELKGQRNLLLRGIPNDLLECDEDQLAEIEFEARDIDDKIEGLRQKINQTEFEVEQAAQGFDVAAARERHRAASEALEDWRDDYSEKAVGTCLMDWLRRTSVEATRPAQFVRANELLIQFTNGSLRLDLDDESEPPAFRAVREGGETAPLESLSVGERVQTLIAVRMAFVEYHETQKLPLFIDEAVATCDDARAERVIESIIKLAKDGRQVFYFTAQSDEIGKWRAMLEKHKVTDHRVIDLAAAREMGEADEFPHIVREVVLPEIPAPEHNEAYGDYANRLRIPGLDPRAQSVDQIHIGHLFNDASVLREYLLMGIKSWFQLRNHWEGHGVPNEHREIAAQVRKSADVTELAFELWCIGRPPNITEQTLQASGCVSDAFLERVSAKASECEWRADRLVESLSNQEIPRWHAANTGRLSEFFFKNGYMSDENCLPEVAILGRLRIGFPDFDEQLINRIVGSLPEVE